MNDKLLSGRLNLSKIPKDQIQFNNAGEQFIWVDVVERLTPGQYGDTHSVVLYDKTNRCKVYLGDLRPREFGGSSAPSGDRPPAGMGSSYKGPDGKWHPLSEMMEQAVKPAPVRPAAPAPAETFDDDLPF